MIIEGRTKWIARRDKSQNIKLCNFSDRLQSLDHSRSSQQILDTVRDLNEQREESFELLEVSQATFVRSLDALT
jgi:hypothetical protein